MLTIATLIDEYLADEKSAYHDLSYRVRLNNRRYLCRIKADRGNQIIDDITRRMFTYWHKRWSEGGKIATGRLFISQLRAVLLHGILSRENSHCYRLLRILDTFELPVVPPRDIRLTSAHAEAIIARAYYCGWYSIALAQALQYELLLKQKDVIGEWIPAQDFKGESDVCSRDSFWTSGIRWAEIDEQFILRHPTNGRERNINVDLKRAPMVMRELQNQVFPQKTGPLLRGEWPLRGPLVICDVTGLPWIASEYRRKWRLLANAAGVPKTVKNMDSRAGAKIVSIAGRDFRALERQRSGAIDPFAIR